MSFYSITRYGISGIPCVTIPIPVCNTYFLFVERFRHINRESNQINIAVPVSSQYIMVNLIVCIFQVVAVVVIIGYFVFNLALDNFIGIAYANGNIFSCMLHYICLVHIYVVYINPLAFKNGGKSTYYTVLAVGGKISRNILRYMHDIVFTYIYNGFIMRNMISVPVIHRYGTFVYKISFGKLQSQSNSLVSGQVGQLSFYAVSRNGISRIFIITVPVTVCNAYFFFIKRFGHIYSKCDFINITVPVGSQYVMVYLIVSILLVITVIVTISYFVFNLTFNGFVGITYTYGNIIRFSTHYIGFINIYVVDENSLIPENGGNCTYNTVFAAVGKISRNIFRYVHYIVFTYIYCNVIIGNMVSVHIIRKNL